MIKRTVTLLAATAALAFTAAPRDGTFIAEVLAPSVLAPALRNLNFDALKMQWIGSITDRPSTVSVWQPRPPPISPMPARKW